MAQCQSWHSYNGRLRIFDCGIDHSSLGWRMAKAVDRIAVHFVIYYLGLWCAWILGRFHQNFQETQHGFKLFTKIDRTNHRWDCLLSGLLSEGNANVLNLFGFELPLSIFTAHL